MEGKTLRKGVFKMSENTMKMSTTDPELDLDDREELGDDDAPD